MSWDSYIDNMLAQSYGNLTKACFIYFDGSFLTSTSHPNSMQVTAEEAAVVGKVMETKGDFSKFMANGIVLENQKYTFIRDMYLDGKCVFGKKPGHGAVIIQHTNKTVLIGFTPEGKEPRLATNAVNIIAEYFTSVNL